MRLESVEDVTIGVEYKGGSRIRGLVVCAANSEVHETLITAEFEWGQHHHSPASFFKRRLLITTNGQPPMPHSNLGPFDDWLGNVLLPDHLRAFVAS